MILMNLENFLKRNLAKINAKIKQTKNQTHPHPPPPPQKKENHRYKLGNNQKGSRLDNITSHLIWVIIILQMQERDISKWKTV